jgi:hypothetical protein
MTRVIADKRLRSMLHDLSQPVEICDESGRVLARVLPTIDRSQYEELEPQISCEELQRRKQNKGRTYTTAEVVSHLEKL